MDEEDKLACALGVTPKSLIESPVLEGEVLLPQEEGSDIELSQDEKDFLEDVALARSNIKKIINKIDGVLDGSEQVAINSEDPEQYQAFSRLVDASLKAHKELLDTHKTKMTLGPSGKPVQQANTINNIMLNMTTAELQQFLKEKKL